MKLHRKLLCVWVLVVPSIGFSQLPDGALERAAAEYAAKLQAATADLNTVRGRIEQERIPLVTESRALEERLIRLRAEVDHLRTQQARADESRQQANARAEALRKGLVYVTGLARDGLKSLEDSLAPGESGLLEERLRGLQAALERSSHETAARAALDTADEMLQHAKRSLGGSSAPGTSLRETDNQLVTGRYVFFGPASFFQSDDGLLAGIVRRQQDSRHAVTHALPEWRGARAGSLFKGEAGTMLADATGGKALRLRETRGNLADHLERGGAVGYIIIGLGGLALVLAALKFLDLRQLAVDEPQEVNGVLEALARGARAEAEQGVAHLRATTRALFAAGLRHVHKSKEVLEEHLFAHLLRERLHHERRLPLLAVIVTAAPLLGLLGTVTGMVKTFTLITVFGSGNAAKLSSGISEALVTTELGLIVAIPTLVLHGYLVHRLQKKLSLLERYSFEFVTAAEEGRAARRVAVVS